MGAALVVVATVALAVTIGIALLGVAFEATVDGTVTVDNPDRPPEWTCDHHGDDPDSQLYETCQRPEQVERDVGSMLREAANGMVHYGLLGVGIWWLLSGGIVHLGARVAGGDAGIGSSLTIAAWALVPELFRLVVGLVVLTLAMDQATLTVTSPNAFSAEFLAVLSTVEPYLLAASLLTIAWQWWILRGGVTERHGLSTAAAGAVAGCVAVISLLVAV